MTLNVTLLLLQLGLLLGVALLLGAIAERFGAPAIVGEILSGVLLGPSILGTFAPAVFAALFPADPGVNGVRAFVVQLGALIFLFLAGQEIELPSEFRQLLRPIPPAALGMVIPFTLALTSVLFGFLPTPDTSTVILTGVGLGLVLAPSSLPVIARIMTDLGIVRTKAGATVQSVALVDDVLGVFALAGIGALLPNAGDGLPVGLVLLLVAGLFVLTLAVLRRVVQWFADRLEARGSSLSSWTGWGVAALLVAAAATEALGVAAVVGSLLTGLALSRVRPEVFEPLRLVARYFFTPLLFASFALGQNVTNSFDLVIVAAIMSFGLGGKLLGVVVGGRAMGYSFRDTLAAGSALLARGTVDLVAASIAFRNGVIDSRVFLACVLMVITGALTAGVVMKRVLGAQPPRTLVRSRAPVLQRLDEGGAPVEEIAIGQRLTIGRDPTNDLALVSDGLVSRNHAIVRNDNGHIRLEDLGSANGTQLWQDGRWREATLDEIDDGDIIVIGTSVFRFARGAR